MEGNRCRIAALNHRGEVFTPKEVWNHLGHEAENVPAFSRCRDVKKEKSFDSSGPKVYGGN